MFCDAYNKKYPLVPFNVDNTTCYVLWGVFNISLCASGKAVYDDDIIGDVCENNVTITFQLGTIRCWRSRKGAPPKRPQVVEEDHTGMVRCTNYGCYKWYKPEENSDTACHYHTSPPVFHDASKGWSCCQK